MGTEVKETKKELSPEEIALNQKRELYAKLRERMSLSKLEAKYMGPGPQFTPYWARKEDEAELARLDLLGFRIVRESADKTSPKRWKAQGFRADGTYIMGDVILMEIPSEEYEFYINANNERAAGQAEAAKAKFIEDAEKQGAPTFKIKRTA